MSAGSQSPPQLGAPTLLCGFPKSGTTLLTALLDGHPELLCFPEETWALKTMARLGRDAWLDHVLRADSLVRLGRGLVETAGGVRDYRGFDHARFEAAARRRWDASSHGTRDLLECVVGGFWESRGSPPVVRWIEKSPEQELLLADVAADWEGLRVVHVVRDPRAVLCSFRRKRARSDQRIYVDGLARRWRAGLTAVLEHEERSPGSVAIVRYEDVVRDHRATLGRVARHLGVSWHEALERPSLLGRPWSGNSMYRSKMEGVSTASLARWTTEIDPRERAVLEACLEPELTALGYGDVTGAGSLVREALPLVLRQRGGVRARGRALRRLLQLQRAPAAPVGSSAFRRARGQSP